jgi:hypothetical protein
VESTWNAKEGFYGTGASFLASLSSLYHVDGNEIVSTRVNITRTTNYSSCQCVFGNQ